MFDEVYNSKIITIKIKVTTENDNFSSYMIKKQRLLCLNFKCLKSRNTIDFNKKFKIIHDTKESMNP